MRPRTRMLALLATVALGAATLWTLVRVVPGGGVEPPEGAAAPGPDALVPPPPRSLSRVAGAGEPGSPPVVERDWVLSGRCVEAGTEAPVADVRVTLHSADGMIARARSDVSGWFGLGFRLASPAEPLVVRVRSFRWRPLEPSRSLSLLSRAATARKLHFEFARRERISASHRAGPWLRLQLIGPADPRQIDWTVRIVERGEQREDVRHWPPGRIRSGSLVEVSWRRVYVRPDPAYAPELVVRDGAGLWSGEVPLGTTVGVFPDPIVVVLTPLAALSGRVVDRSRAVLEGAQVSAVLDVGGAPPTDPELWKHATSDREGAFRFGGLTPGSWLLRVQARDQRELERVVPLALGENDAGELVVSARTPAGSIVGSVRSRSGELVQNVMVRLESADGGDVGRSAWTDEPRVWSGHGLLGMRARGGDVAGFGFDELPEGLYTVTPLALDGYAIEPRSRTVRAPAEGVDFWREDDVDKVGFGFRVFDARTHEPIERFEATVMGADWWYPGSTRANHGERIGEVPRVARLRWTVFAEGYRPAHGDMGSMRAGNGTLLADVELERGWGVELVVRDGRDAQGAFDESTLERMLLVSRAAALEGARVLADGREVGATDAGGRLRMALEREPERLEIRLEGWVVAPSVQFRAGRVRGSGRNVLVWMVPRP